ncbi:kinase-like domain-containing protein [Xylariaceae sp. FL0662B]|nr:kinase-like domain-containing protein [Xylariaceae sp. FL0662B]
MEAPQALPLAMSSHSRSHSPSHTPLQPSYYPTTTTITTNTNTNTPCTSHSGAAPSASSHNTGCGSKTATPSAVNGVLPSTSNSNPSLGTSGFQHPRLDLELGLITLTPTDVFPSPSPTLTPSLSLSTPSVNAPASIESPRHYPIDLSAPIPEECDEETGSESFANEPVTPVSNRQSQDFRYCEQTDNDFYQRHDSITNVLVASSSGIPEEHSGVSLSDYTNKEAPDTSLLLSSSFRSQPPAPSYAPPPPPPLVPNASVEPHNNNPITEQPPTEQTENNLAEPDRPPSSSQQSSTSRLALKRRASYILTRAVSSISIFRRNSSETVENVTAMEFPEPSYATGSSETNAPSANQVAQGARRRPFSYHRSIATTRSNTPPSPGSPLETATPNAPDGALPTSMPSSRDFFNNQSKKHRALTGSRIRDKVHFVGNKSQSVRRTKSLEKKKKREDELHNLTRQPWAIPPDAGTGMKARRLSLSLPDDFTVDVAELTKEYEYQHKFLGRHGKHLGKGATSKVTLMVRKGCPGELYAVKEFRSKKSSETADDYEKKIKSEYSIAKSLHHPNIVETVRLCTHHGRWNHVMEYCSEGDLFSLVSKKYLKEESRRVDRLCLFKQLCQGVNYLHSNGIAHRDIKLENLLITKDSKLKITDFGVSEVFSGIHPGLREAGGQCGVGMVGEVRLCQPGICGSLPYIAPEVLSKNVDYDPQALDVWSSAVVMLYLIFNANLWEKAEAGLTSTTQFTYNQLVQGWKKIDDLRASDPEKYKDSYPKVTAFDMFIEPPPLKRLLLNMLHPDPEKRISMANVITNRWMKNVECCQLESYDDPTKFIDASKKDATKSTVGKIFCHNHLPIMSNSHSLPPMPGKPGY